MLPAPRRSEVACVYRVEAAGRRLDLEPGILVGLDWLVAHEDITRAPDLPTWCAGLVPDRYHGVAALVDLALFLGFSRPAGQSSYRFLRRRVLLRRGRESLGLLVDQGLGWQSPIPETPPRRLDDLWEEIATGIGQVQGS
ncbi:MAG TPA: hypothetical protein VNL71_03830 [Chloroflexota bacterium]|nr:hypothetical protein [Chloroflexota bacterium]